MLKTRKSFYSNIDKMVYIFNRAIINILCNFIPHEMVLLDDRDHSLMNKKIEKFICEKKLFPSK